MLVYIVYSLISSFLCDLISVYVLYTVSLRNKDIYNNTLINGNHVVIDVDKYIGLWTLALSEAYICLFIVIYS